jgi:hypothetical protein
MSSKSDPSALPRRGIEQILATCDNTTLVVRASRDGKLDVMSNAFKDDGRVTILDDERLEVRNHGGQVCVLRRYARPRK